jgi:tetratricopeptide (TPR) repeat protein
LSEVKLPSSIDRPSNRVSFAVSYWRNRTANLQSRDNRRKLIGLLSPAHFLRGPDRQAQELHREPIPSDSGDHRHDTESGNAAPAKQLVKDALTLARDKNIDATASLALALAGDPPKAAELSDQLSRHYPANTAMKFEILPELRAAEILQRDPRKAIDILAVSMPYELAPSALLYPAYFRGYAYVAMRQGPAAAQEFQKIIDHPGLVQMDPIGALAHLGLGRAYVVAGDQAKARAAYNDFLTIWNDADPNIPILKEAKMERARLR